MPARVKPAHHRGTHQVRSRQIRDAANADPTCRCARCGLTLSEAKRRWGLRTHWQAGHLNAGQTDGPLRPECSHCNASHGATLGNRQRGQRRRRISQAVAHWRNTAW